MSVRLNRLNCVLGALVLTSACGSSPVIEPQPIGGDRPPSVFMTPDAWDGKTPIPLLMVLHGYGEDGLVQAIYLQLESLVNTKQIILVAPDGLVDSKGKRYWNAVDTCCDFDGRGEDDVAFLTGLVTEIESKYAVDTKRVYLVGHSNGAAMTMRLACDAPGMFTAALELAGPFWSMPDTQCHPATPLALRVLHGTADMEVPYAGGAAGDVGNLNSPGAEVIAAFWAQKNGCSASPDTSAPPLDLDVNIAGAETTVTRFTGCAAGADTELWSIQGAGHIPGFFDGFGDFLWAYFSTHTR